MDTYSIVDDFSFDLDVIKNSNTMSLKCPNENDLLYIGLTQYGVSKTNKCQINQNDCLVNVDYLSNQFDVEFF